MSFYNKVCISKETPLAKETINFTIESLVTATGLEPTTS